LEGQVGEEGHELDFDVGHQREEGEGIVTGARLNGIGEDLVSEEAQVAGFVVADLLDALVGGVGPAGGGEGGFIEKLDALLVEGDDPFGGQEILEEEIVKPQGAGGGVQDGAGVVGTEGGRLCIVGAEEGGLAGDGAEGWVREDLRG
jgi:hypothetical protein